MTCRFTLSCQPATSDRGAGPLTLEVRRSGNLAVWYNSSLSPAAGLVLSPWGGVVLRLGQEHGDGQPFVPKELA